ncbi:alpha/beta-hydrolase [Metschnikowia bicuspidata var. bicuspidata NRRL YB-4993]|uniref:triacylglycerol lipase n=1 Tax=Metschnikowia bicuspidata var. bicuspidata NRRL YB-4993 TaxID=869754 RepID=A0A1A0H539_9ASCO|nr:alpha/beta-hydrolase [Metschnikowia bicuspidata var. bicuspidata NRRL YB-4993]OBA19038.1 alpha/beta-hydrolase [Metschnikowia bicuspidata var. bicuspidata NRRL YB-4993]
MKVYENLGTYAALIDISYCIDTYHQIEEPFQCDLCGSFESNMSLVSQWYFDDSVCGYISTTFWNIFDYDDSGNSVNRKTIIVSLRGTRSLHDTITDLKVDLVKYENIGQNLLLCGPDCRVHEGFWRYYKSTLEVMESKLKSEIEMSFLNYEIIFIGHSLGGSVALLLAIHFLDMGFSNLTLVTMGQPLIGNKEFTTWADEVLGSSFPVAHNSYARKYIRVIRKGDIVTTVPRSGLLFERYCSFENQIYINATADTVIPSPEEVVDCFSGENPTCIARDFALPFAPLTDFYHNHNTYFRHMGLCGIHI